MNRTLRAWATACRPKTLPLACMSILVGSVLALSAGTLSWPVLALSFCTAGLLQVLSNLANDYGDGLRGVDDSNRLGPVRALQSGMLTPAQLKLSLFIVAVLAIISGLWLIQAAALDAADVLIFSLLGVLSIIAALTYTLGRKPYGYAGLGDASVWLFFGCLGVLGSCYLHGAALHASLLLPASACGLLAVAVLNVNNMRDIDNDRSHGKHTLAVRLGLSRAQLYHQALLLAALLLFFIYLAVNHSFFPSLLFLLAGIPVHRHAKAIRRVQSSAQMAPLLPAMVGCSMLVNGWFCLVLLLQTFATV
ncbi:MAG: 1,4-dihydroxy-2-naphthoate polyprenyltransferase [Gammaproteobacteria bacterium]|jgi:1,4-dihydroxy-2-naphthoate octaprenyltransferase|nr:1,4-dihydroxy-2-naphthoate polyprenyltransferase [Gammaproteobacteria bacterium]